MKPFGIAGIQMPVIVTESNVDNMRARLDALMAIYPWIHMVMFSELAACGPLPAMAETLPGPAEDALAEMAKKHHIWLLTGSIHERAKDDCIYNTASVIDPDGNVVGRYRKMFVFQPYEKEVSPGHDFFYFDVPDVGRFGVIICYDKWFPEVIRTLASLGAEVILCPTMTPSIDRDAELAISRAMSVINQCYFFDINGSGIGGCGRSIVCGPQGNVLHEAGDSEAYIPVEINFEVVRRSREAGVLRLGQPLKSFRDRPVDFPVYQFDSKSAYLDSLGPLEKPTRDHTTTEADIDGTGPTPAAVVHSAAS